MCRSVPSSSLTGPIVHADRTSSSPPSPPGSNRYCRLSQSLLRIRTLYVLTLVQPTERWQVGANTSYKRLKTYLCYLKYKYWVSYTWLVDYVQKYDPRYLSYVIIYHNRYRSNMNEINLNQWIKRYVYQKEDVKLLSKLVWKSNCQTTFLKLLSQLAWL